MLNINAIKSAIPLVFSFIIIGFIAKLGYDNAHLQQANTTLANDKSTLEKDIRQLNEKNDGLAQSVQMLVRNGNQQNDIVKAETKRRTAAEMKQQRLQDEIKDALKSSQCNFVVLPDGAVERLREESDSVRSHKGKSTTHPSKPSK
ncbi:alkaline shock response membrane anchor protein AmaP [Citrobacter pasteurii]|uniref:alkaline shock response membrane anchor protein AmaP n=1 Tax=Citrobacter pasteurii TaxID=1563222 RepID=UPI001FEE03D0|nr:alkaline shock response membrane anchor protein AmaP [Citrobacter pasteurii]